MRAPPARLCARLAAVSLVALLALSAPTGSGADPTSGDSRKASDLRRQTTVLQGRSQHALLDLYALETQLQRARSQLASLQSRAARIGTEQALVRRQLRIVRHAFAVSQRQLADRLRLLYKQAQPDSIAIILGASSLDDAITNLDAVNRAAKQSQGIIGQTTSAGRSLRRLSAALGRRRAQLAALKQQTAATASRLERARAERTSYVASLRSKERLNRSTIASLEAAAQAAEVKAQTLTLALAAGPALAGSPSVDPATSTTTAGAPEFPSSAAGGRTITVNSTGYSLQGRTATGVPVGYGVVAVDPLVIPLGTRLTIPGYGEGVAADTGGAVRGDTIDLWFPSRAQARAWGRRTVTLTLY